jgi:hypothetical protein
VERSVKRRGRAVSTSSGSERGEIVFNLTPRILLEIRKRASYGYGGSSYSKVIGRSFWKIKDKTELLQGHFQFHAIEITARFHYK